MFVMFQLHDILFGLYFIFIANRRSEKFFTSTANKQTEN